MEAVTEKPACAKCGAEVRDGTAFCYACGAPVVETVADPAVDLEKTAKMNGAATEAVIEPEAAAETDEDRRNKAREERKKARVAQRKPVEYSWEPNNDMMYVLSAAILITAIVGAVVAAMVFWK